MNFFHQTKQYHNFIVGELEIIVLFLTIECLHISGHFDLLTVLSDQPDSPVWSVRDASGNTLFHRAASVPFSKHALRAVEILSKTLCNPNICNNR